MSASVVVAKATHPLFAMVELAEELLANAKRQAAQIGKYSGHKACTLDFRVITSATARSLAVVRREEYGIGGPGMWLTGRPYPCRRIPELDYPSIEDLIEGIAGLQAARFPRSKLQQWGALAAEAEPDAAMLQIAYLRSRLGAQQSSALDELNRRLCLTAHGTQMFFHDPTGTEGHQRSPLPDIVELYDFQSP
jgi:hypothetical protein